MGVLRLACTVFFAVLALAMDGCGGALNVDQHLATTKSDLRTAAPEVQRYLYVANHSPASVEAYALPISTGETPSVTLSLSDASGLAVGKGQLTVTEGNSFSSFALPLKSGENPKATISLNTAYGLSYGNGVVYVSDYADNLVSSYTLPLTTGESPSATITGFSNPYSLGVDSKFLYVGNYGNGTPTGGSIEEFALPLKSSESGTIVLSRLNSPDGIAVNSMHVYVASYFGKSVSVYKMPLTTGEKAQARLIVPGNAFGLAVDPQYLYVSDFASNAWIYTLPIKRGESPKATLSGLGEVHGLAVLP